MRTSITRKLTRGLLVPTTAVMALLSAASYLYFSEQFKQSVAIQQQASLRIIADHLDSDLRDAKRLLSAVAASIDPDPAGRPDRLRRQLDSHTGARVYFDGGFALVALDGRLLAATTPEVGREVEDPRLRALASEAIRAGGTVLSPPRIATFPPKHPVVTFATPVPGPSGRPAAALLGFHDLLEDPFLPYIAKVRVGEKGYMYVVHEDRTILLHPDRERILRTLPPGTDHGLERALEGFNGTSKGTAAGGIRVLSSSRSLSEADWIMLSSLPLSEAYAPLGRTLGVVSAFFLAVSALLVFSVRFLSGRLTAPLARLADHVRSMPGKSGDDRRFEIRSGDEVELLADALNGMAGEIERQNRKLQEESELYRLITEFASEMVVLRRPDDSVGYISGNCLALTGYSEADFYGDARLIDRIIHPDDREKWARHRDQLAEDGSYGSLDLRIVARDGRIRWMNHVCRDVVSPSGIPAGNRGGFRDISRRVRAEQELSEQRHFLENLLRSSSTPTFVIGPDHRVLFWNRALEELTGLPASEVVGTDGQWRPFYPEARPCLCDLLLDGQAGRVGEFYRDHAFLPGGEGIVRAEGWYPSLGGKERYIFFDAAPVRSPDGRVLAVVETLQDITHRKEAERLLARQQEELQEKHVQLTALFAKVSEGKHEWEQTTDAIDDIVILVGKDGAVRRCNRALAQFLDAPYETVIGSDWRALLGSASLDVAALDGGGGELFHAPSGRWYAVKIYPYRDDGSAVVALHDLTEIRKVSEELADAYGKLKTTHMQLLQQEKMASIGQLAAGVAHEINNPIGFIKSNLGTLAKYAERLRAFIEAQGEAVASSAPPALAGSVGEARRRLKVDAILEDLPKLVAECSEGTERVRVIVQNLKSFSRVDETERQRVDLNGCVESAVAIAWNELKYKATLLRDFGDLPPVACYPQQLNQVFLNLLVNAAHAIDGRGEVTVRTRRDGGHVLVSVADTGHGIPEAIRNRIFEPFFTTKEVGKGTGLGLSISYEIVSRHGGSIGVESEPGRGTTFTVRLPIGEGSPE